MISTVGVFWMSAAVCLVERKRVCDRGKSTTPVILLYFLKQNIRGWPHAVEMLLGTFTFEDIFTQTEKKSDISAPRSLLASNIHGIPQKKLVKGHNTYFLTCFRF